MIWDEGNSGLGSEGEGQVVWLKWNGNIAGMLEGETTQMPEGML